MTSLTINGINYDNIATRWSELTLRQYCQLTANKEEIAKADNFSHARMISILTGIDYDALMNTDCSQFATNVLPAIDFIEQDIDVFSLKRKSEIKIGATVVKTIVEPKSERLGQKLYIEQLVEKAIKEKTNLCDIVAKVVACYYAPIINDDEVWKEKKVDELTDVINDSLLIEVFPEANFFLTGCIEYKK